jgi:hypothetical protein
MDTHPLSTSPVEAEAVMAAVLRETIGGLPALTKSSLQLD